MTVSSSTANSNAGYGISAFGGSVTNSTAQGNGGVGIEAKAAIGCSASANGGAQISAPGRFPAIRGTRSPRRAL